MLFFLLLVSVLSKTIYVGTDAYVAGEEIGQISSIQVEAIVFSTGNCKILHRFPLIIKLEKSTISFEAISNEESTGCNEKEIKINTKKQKNKVSDALVTYGDVNLCIKFLILGIVNALKPLPLKKLLLVQYGLLVFDFIKFDDDNYFWGVYQNVFSSEYTQRVFGSSKFEEKNGGLYIGNRQIFSKNSYYDGTIIPKTKSTLGFSTKILDLNLFSGSKRLKTESYEVWVDDKCNSGSIKNAKSMEIGKNGICFTAVNQFKVFRNHLTGEPLAFCNKGVVSLIGNFQDLKESEKSTGNVLECKNLFPAATLAEYELIPSTCNKNL